MQTYNEITNELTGKDLPGKVYENMQSLKSDFSGTEFPTTNLVAGMTCFRTDQNKVYRLLSDLQTWKLESDLNFDGGVTIATQTEAEEGTNNVAVMTPLRVENRLFKTHCMKFYNNFTQWGLTNADATPQDLYDNMPAYSTITQYCGTSFIGLSIPANGVLTIIKYANDNTPMRFIIQGRSQRKVWIASFVNGDSPQWSGWKRLTFDDEVLLLSGGTMTGNIHFNNGTDTQIYKDVTDGRMILRGSTGAFADGASFYLHGKDHSSRKGVFDIYAHNGTDNCVLSGFPDGRLKWDEKDVMTAYTIWSHSQYRGKSLGTSLTTAQSNAIRNGTFDDIYVGDYWTIGGVVYRIVAIDYYYNCGDTACTTHHVVVVPDTILYSDQMNTSNVVTGGYVGSAMYTSNLANAKTTILNAFGSGHILTIRQYFSNAASSYVTGGTWADANVWLMNEINVYGCSVFANLIHGTNWVAAYTIDNCQYPAFRANPRLIHIRQTYWLRDVATSTSFARVSGHGSAYHGGASDSVGVRPAFCVY